MAETGTNPYLALLQQEQKPPGWQEILQHVANLGFGMAGGLGQAASQGGSTIGGLGTGLILGNQMNAQAAQRAEQERMKRLEWQFRAQEHEDKRAEIQRKEDQLKTYLNMPGFQAVAPPGPLMGPGGTPTTGPGTPDQNAIGGIESGGRYDAVGPVANKAGNRAYGKYQIMDFNVGPWTQEVFGKPMTPQEFLANPQAQDAVFNTKFGQYSQKYGPVGASRAWFAGEGGMNNPNASDVNGMTVQRYGDRFAQSRGVAAAPAGPGGVAPPPVGPRGLPAAAPGGAGPTLSALPAFEGSGMGTIQPGALAEGVEPKVNLPAPFVPPPPAPGTPTGPSGPNVVQAQATPGPNTPPMVAGAGPAPGGANPPPVFTPPTRVPVPPEVARHFKGLAAAGLITVGQAEKSIEDYGENLNKQVHESAREQYKAQVQVWQQREQVAIEQRKIQAQVEAEQRAVAQKDKEHARSREEEGDWIRQNGVLTFVPKKDIKPGMTKEDTPKEPPAPGTRPGDIHILEQGQVDTPQYAAAWNRVANDLIEGPNGQKFAPVMTYPKPTHGQTPAPASSPAAGAPQPGAPAAPAGTPPGMTPVGTPNYTETQTKNYGFATRLQSSLPELEAMLRGDDGKYSTTKLPSSKERAQMMSSYYPDSLLSAETKKFRRLATDIVTGILRPESGAAISLGEYPQEVAKYIPQPGDSHEEIAAKLRAIREVGRTIAEGSGRPLDKFGGVFGGDGEPGAKPGGATSNVPVYDTSGKRIR